MNKKLNFQLLLYPIILIILSSALITGYHIYQFIKQEKLQIEKLTEKFIFNEKDKTYKHVHYIKEKIMMHEMLVEKDLKKEIKNKVDFTISSMDTLYDKYKNSFDKKSLEDMLKSYIQSVPFDDKNGYFFLYDLNTNKVISHKLKEFIGKDMSDFTDIKGQNLLETKLKILETQNSGYHSSYFKKPSDRTKEYKKIVYFVKFEQFNWLLGTGKYLEDTRKKIKESTFTKIATMENSRKDDLFINEVYNINGGKNFAKNIYSKNDPNRIGHYISTDGDVNTHRQRVLNRLKQKSEYFDNYEYCYFGTDKTQMKSTYFYYYEPWSIIIGSGFYMDQLNKDIETIKEQGREKIKDQMISILIVNICILILFILISMAISKKINEIISKNQKEIEELNSLLNNKVDKQLKQIHEKDMLLAQKYKSQSLGEMLSMITHQWRQPLNNINSITAKLYMLVRSGEITNDIVLEDTKQIEKQIIYMSQTITDFKQFYQQSELKELFDLNETMQNSLNIIFPKYYKGVKPKIKLNLCDNGLIYGNKSQLQQILLSIINNSIENFKIEKTQEPRITIDIFKNDHTIDVYVADNGGGIKEKNIKKVFDLYYTTKKDKDAQGIGLYIARMLARNCFEGDLKVENSKEGAVFILSFENNEKV